MILTPTASERTAQGYPDDRSDGSWQAGAWQAAVYRPGGEPMRFPCTVEEARLRDQDPSVCRLASCHSASHFSGQPGIVGDRAAKAL